MRYPVQARISMKSKPGLLGPDGCSEHRPAALPRCLPGSFPAGSPRSVCWAGGRGRWRSSRSEKRRHNGPCEEAGPRSWHPTPVEFIHQGLQRCDLTGLQKGRSSPGRFPHPVNGDGPDGEQTHSAPRPFPIKGPVSVVKGIVHGVDQSHGGHDDPVRDRRPLMVMGSKRPRRSWTTSLIRK